ncbi:hypothetical protein [Streptacidiphilus rugosus]|uniref:hypothetical protein n=1 Tax=Streptacidiphilus rugosus TaxID=405783 RepID=UPI000568FE7C|nr:hypothetical protein [Streptacidiphilus rugosus]
MTLAMPLVAFLAVVVFLLIRSGELRTWQAVLLTVFGFYLARTPLGNVLAYTVQWLVTGFTHNH